MWKPKVSKKKQVFANEVNRDAKKELQWLIAKMLDRAGESSKEPDPELIQMTSMVMLNCMADAIGYLEAHTHLRFGTPWAVREAAISEGRMTGYREGIVRAAEANGVPVVNGLPALDENHHALREFQLRKESYAVLVNKITEALAQKPAEEKPPEEKLAEVIPLPIKPREG